MGMLKRLIRIFYKKQKYAKPLVVK